jgi:hypothetical protein
MGSSSARPPKRTTFALLNPARSIVRSATSTRSQSAASIIASCTDTVMRPHGGPGSASIPCRSRSNFGDARGRQSYRKLKWGNQQKVVIARWVAAGFETLLCFDPTRGIDIGTKHQIYRLLREMADARFVRAAVHLRAAGNTPGLRPGDCLVRGEIVAELPARARRVLAESGFPNQERSD